MAFKQKKLFNLWIALTLSILFFYPLIATLHDNFIILQWKLQNTFELLLAVSLLSGLFYILLWIIHNKISNARAQVLFFTALCLIPFVSFFIHFLMQIGLKNFLITLGDHAYQNKVVVLGSLLSIILLFCFFLLKWPRRVHFLLIIFLIALSSLNLLAGWTILSHIRTDTITFLRNQKDNLNKNINHAKNNFIIFLFDEMSYEYLFKNGEIDPRYVNFKRFADISEVYHAASSPGQQTLTAIPGLLMAKRYDNLSIKYDWIYRITAKQKAEYLTIDKANLFDVAKDKGYMTFVVGNYLPYCEMFKDYLDVCRSFSEYNYGGVNKDFSILNPIMTVFNIWPRQKPQGLIKNIGASLLQKKRIEETRDFVFEAFKQKDAFFCLLIFISPIYLLCSIDRVFIGTKNHFYRMTKIIETSLIIATKYWVSFWKN